MTDTPIAANGNGQTNEIPCFGGSSPLARTIFLAEIGKEFHSKGPPPYLGGYGMGMARVFLRVDRHCVGAAYFSSGRAKKVFTKRVRRMRVAGAGAKNKLRSTRWAA